MKTSEEKTPETKEAPVDVDEDEAIIEDVDDEPEVVEAKEPEKVVQKVPVTIQEWKQLNSQTPLWMRYVSITSSVLHLI